MVIIADNSPSELAKCAGFLKKWEKRGIALPLFLSDDYIRRSLDSFPLEFMAMKAFSRVVAGGDVLGDLSFDPADVRSQCERELKGKLIHLRAEYLSSRGDAKRLMNLVGLTLDAFRLVFTGVLFLKNIDVPAATGDLTDAVAGAYDLDATLFKKLLAVAEGDVSVSGSEADELFDRYVEELMKLSRAVDIHRTGTDPGGPQSAKPEETGY